MESFQCCFGSNFVQIWISNYRNVRVLEIWEDFTKPKNQTLEKVLDKRFCEICNKQVGSNIQRPQLCSQLSKENNSFCQAHVVFCRVTEQSNIILASLFSWYFQNNVIVKFYILSETQMLRNYYFSVSLWEKFAIYLRASIILDHWCHV